MEERLVRIEQQLDALCKHLGVPLEPKPLRFATDEGIAAIQKVLDRRVSSVVSAMVVDNPEVT